MCSADAFRAPARPLRGVAGIAGRRGGLAGRFDVARRGGLAGRSDVVARRAVLIVDHVNLNHEKGRHDLLKVRCGVSMVSPRVLCGRSSRLRRRRDSSRGSIHVAAAASPRSRRGVATTSKRRRRDPPQPRERPRPAAVARRARRDPQAFYFDLLGLTADPRKAENIAKGKKTLWANAGIAQLHLPEGAPNAQPLDGRLTLARVPVPSAHGRRVASEYPRRSRGAAATRSVKYPRAPSQVRVAGPLRRGAARGRRGGSRRHEVPDPTKPRRLRRRVPLGHAGVAQGGSKGGGPARRAARRRRRRAAHCGHCAARTSAGWEANFAVPSWRDRLASRPRRRRDPSPRTIWVAAAPSPRNIHVAAAASTRPVSADYLGRGRGRAVPTEYPRRGRGGAATRPHGISTSRPRRRRDHGLSASRPRRRRDCASLQTRRPVTTHRSTARRTSRASSVSTRK